MAIIQPIEERVVLNQGSVVDKLPWNFNPAPLGLVLTNECDFDLDKASYVTVAALVNAHDVLHASKEFNDMEAGPLSRKQWNGLTKRLKRWIHNTEIRRYFLVDASCLELPPLFADFQNLLTVPTRDARRCQVVAELPTPYREKCIMHFASYVSRIPVDRVGTVGEERLVAELARPYAPT